MSAPESTVSPWDIYYAVHVEGRPLDAVAKAAGISLVEAQKISDDHYKFLKDTSRAWLPVLPAREQAALVWRYHDEQLEELLRETMNAWRESRREITTRHDRGASSYTTTKVSFGQVRYLMTAARISHLRITAAEHLVKLAQKYGDPRDDGSQPPPYLPPTGGCAPEEHEDDYEPLAADKEVVLSIAEEETCADASGLQKPADLAKIDFSTPVRAAQAPLNRQQKRAREKRKRQLQRAGK